MKTIFLNNYKTLLYILFGVGALYLMVLFFTPKPEMSELDKYKLNQLNKDIQDIKNNQIKLMNKLQTWTGLCEMAKTTNCQIFTLYTQGQQIKVFSQVYKYCLENNYVVEKMVM